MSVFAEPRRRLTSSRRAVVPVSLTKLTVATIRYFVFASVVIDTDFTRISVVVVIETAPVKAEAVSIAVGAAAPVAPVAPVHPAMPSRPGVPSAPLGPVAPSFPVAPV